MEFTSGQGWSGRLVPLFRVRHSPLTLGILVVPELIRRLCHTDFGAIGNLGHSFMTKFNQRTANNPDVKYFAWAGEVSTPTANYTSVSSFQLTCSRVIWPHCHVGQLSF